jgi:RNA polymerase sigma factor (sigma-70 family)
MAAGPEALIRYIRGLVSPSELDEVTDAALLGRYISAREERAFAALVERHGPLVLQVCRRLLGNVHDAEDAFQAVFLILARKAATVHPREALPAWLHGVARRVALKTRAARARPLPGPRTPPASGADPLAELSARELLMMIDEELHRLPEVYRLPVILCCLEGRSLEEAARQLGWTPGSVKGRLERGRARLHDRLSRRGLTLSAALAAAEVSRSAASAAVVARLVAGTVRGAMAFGRNPRTGAGGISAGAAALARETLQGMAMAKLKAAAVLLLATGLLAAGFGIHRAAPSARPSVPPSVERAGTVPAALVNNHQAVPRDEADTPIKVSGRVLDPRGKPVAAARLYVGYSVRGSALDRQQGKAAYPLRATSGADGRFHFSFAKSELDARVLDDSRPAVAAVADGFGVDWAEIPEPAEGAELSLRLVEDLPVNGRIVDPNRQPVAGARVFVLGIRSDSEEGVTRFLRGDLDSWHPRRWRGPFPEQPPFETTDAGGRFRITGLGRDRIASLGLAGPGLRNTSFTAVARPAAANPGARRVHMATFEYVTSPSQPIRGVVRDRTTGRPVAGVRIFALLDSPPALTDEAGRFEILGCPKMPQGYTVMAQPQSGQPYFAAKTLVPDRPGFDPLTVNLDLTGGISVSGRVTDQATGRPPRAAVVEYHPLFPNPHSSGLTYCIAMAASSAATGPDGSYRLVVLPGPGVVCVAASPRDSYAVARVDERQLAGLFHDGRNHGGNQGLHTAAGAGMARVLSVNRYNALALINPSERAEMPALDLTLQPGCTVRGRLVGPGGTPLTGVEVVGLTARPDEEVLDSASFLVRGLNPRRGRDLCFHHRARGLGQVVTIRGDEPGPLTVRLDPCGSVVGRLLDKRGNPVPGVRVRLSGRRGLEVVAETDREGRFRAALPPGQTYSLGVYSLRALARNVGEEVEVEPGGSKDLGDLPLGD